VNLLYFSLLRRSSDGVGNKCDANVMQMWCKCFAIMMKNLASNALSLMYYKMQYTKKVIILFDFLFGSMCSFEFFFPILCILVLKDVWRLVNIVCSFLTANSQIRVL
jgi:hypothetical protein